MPHVSPSANSRKRAPSKKSLFTKKKILDAAEQVFAERTFEGAALRDIAKAAGVTLALVSFHGGAKEELFHKVVARRAEEISRARLDKLQKVSSCGSPVTLRDLLECIVMPVVEKIDENPRDWAAYVRLMAIVSADPRWHKISEDCFDPTARVFVDKMCRVAGTEDAAKVSACYVYAVSVMIALCTTGWRVEAMAGTPVSGESQQPKLRELASEMVDFCEAGARKMLGN